MKQWNVEEFLRDKLAWENERALLKTEIERLSTEKKELNKKLKSAHIALDKYREIIDRFGNTTPSPSSFSNSANEQPKNSPSLKSIRLPIPKLPPPDQKKSRTSLELNDLTTEASPATEEHSPAWRSAKLKRKQLPEGSAETPYKTPAKKRQKKSLLEDPTLAGEFWKEEESVTKISSTPKIKGVINLLVDSPDRKQEIKPEDDDAPVVNLKQEAQLLKEQYDSSKSIVKMPTKAEREERQKELERRRVRASCYEEVERRKDVREKMTGYDCEMCQAFYDALDDDIFKDKSSIVMKCSRHKYNFSPPRTPPGYWQVDFPESPNASASTVKCNKTA